MGGRWLTVYPCEQNLRTVVEKRLEKDPYSPDALLPEKMVRMKKRMEEAIQRAMPKVRVTVEFDFGIKRKPLMLVYMESFGGVEFGRNIQDQYGE